MANSTKDSREKVSLEELLRFKKAERPDNQFWDKFDQELHQRMMQSLVKKDPWPVQLLRGLSGRFAQTTGIAAAAALLAIVVIRPAFVANEGSIEQPVFAEAVVETSQIADLSDSEMDSMLLADATEADYAIDMLSSSAIDMGDSVTPDYNHDRLDVASYDRDAYSSGMALTGVTSTGLASLVY